MSQPMVTLSLKPRTATTEGAGQKVEVEAAVMEAAVMETGEDGARAGGIAKVLGATIEAGVIRRTWDAGNTSKFVRLRNLTSLTQEVEEM